VGWLPVVVKIDFDRCSIIVHESAAATVKHVTPPHYFRQPAIRTNVRGMAVVAEFGQSLSANAKELFSYGAEMLLQLLVIRKRDQEPNCRCRELPSYSLISVFRN
jgi:hypothetical protein